MRSTGDLTSAALIRDAAMRLFAQRGTAAVTIRAIAREAGVSPSLVIHHYGSKESLKRAVDEHVVAFLDEMLATSLEISAEDPLAAATDAALASRLADSPALPYLRRILIDGGDAAKATFRSLYDMSLEICERYEAAGAFRPSSDNRARAAVLLANDMAVILLRDQVREVLGVDPIEGAGLARWGAAVMEIYAGGVFNPATGTKGGAR
jgi:AcrR family transcriptional regulator